MHGTFHFDEGFYYWRHLGNRILLGGARNADFAGEETLDTGTSEVIQQQLEQFLIRHLPQYFTAENILSQIDYRWGGLMAMHESKLPVLQALAPNVWGAMSCNGMGVAITPVFAAQVVRSLLTNA
jgi:glycine/D-amino acid oxidase-like deaminating enzyme